MPSTSTTENNNKSLASSSTAAAAAAGATTTTNSLLSTQAEKPQHYSYLKEFRCDQCPQFLQHKCTNHKPFTCFHWHFMNQRRRRPIRKRDGSFNYSPDIYCTKYDETTGICADGDECPYLHRTAGDTERRYHLRYYKTGICVYDTDSRGFCVKNGAHCAFAHGMHDLRNPVYDISELRSTELGATTGFSGENSLPGVTGDANSGLNTLIGPNSLDKERNALTDDPRWLDTTYVLANYKTEVCKRPPRLCRQGYACPQYHNNKDRRRSPKKYKYRSTPCPSVKQGDEWGDPTNCEAGDACAYCHTRTEQQFHPEIYKSTKCNDMQQTNYCPRGAFCAFAHIENEISAARDLNMDNSTDLATLLSSKLPPTTSASSTSASANGGECDSNNITTTAPSTGNGTSSCTIVSTSSTNCTLTNSNNTPTNSITIARAILNNNGTNQSKMPSTGSNSIASSLPDHFGTSFDSSHFGNLQSQLFNRETTSPMSNLGTAPTTGSQVNLGLGNFLSNSVSTSSTNNQTSGPGPIARPRSYSSSNAHTSSMAAAANNNMGETLLSSYFKNVEEKNNLLLNGPHANRKLSTPSSSLFASGGNHSSLFSSLTSNRDSGSLFGAPVYSTTADTVESCLGLAVEDLSLEDIHLEASLEKELGPSSQSRGNSNNLVDTVDPVSNSNSVLGRSPGQQNLLGSTAPVNIPGARIGGHRSTIANLSSPPMNSPLTSLGAHSAGAYGVSPYTRTTSLSAVGHGVSSSAASSLYDFTSGTNMSPSSVDPSTGSASSVVQAAASMLENQRLRDELALCKAKWNNWEESLMKASTAVEVWKREAEEAKRREKLLEQQRDEAFMTINTLRKEVEQMSGGPFLHTLNRASELENLSINQLKQLQQQLRSDLECIDKELTSRTQINA